jgi:hypothetical protein
MQPSSKTKPDSPPKSRNSLSYPLFSKVTRRNVLISFFPALFFSGCRKFRSDPKKITMRPRIFLEGAAPIPILDEYDIRLVQLGTISNIMTDDPTDRMFALWLSFDRRSAMTVQKETASNVGRRLHLVVGGEIVGVHPIEGAITNGVLPFVLSSNMPQENALFLYNELNTSLVHIRAEYEAKKG